MVDDFSDWKGCDVGLMIFFVWLSGFQKRNKWINIFLSFILFLNQKLPCFLDFFSNFFFLKPLDPHLDSSSYSYSYHWTHSFYFLNQLKSNNFNNNNNINRSFVLIFVFWRMFNHISYEKIGKKKKIGKEKRKKNGSIFF